MQESATLLVPQLGKEDSFDCLYFTFKSTKWRGVRRRWAAGPDRPATGRTTRWFFVGLVLPDVRLAHARRRRRLRARAGGGEALLQFQRVLPLPAVPLPPPPVAPLGRTNG